MLTFFPRRRQLEQVVLLPNHTDMAVVCSVACIDTIRDVFDRYMISANGAEGQRMACEAEMQKMEESAFGNRSVHISPFFSLTATLHLFSSLSHLASEVFLMLLQCSGTLIVRILDHGSIW